MWKIHFGPFGKWRKPTSDSESKSQALLAKVKNCATSIEGESKHLVLGGPGRVKVPDKNRFSI
jgi:hypothetical protein